MEKAYPYVRGRIGQRGTFHSSSGERLTNRLALTPYTTYNSLQELRRFYSLCKERGSEEDVTTCLTHDYKQDVPGPKK